jgi:hypothetical protein
MNLPLMRRRVAAYVSQLSFRGNVSLYSSLLLQLHYTLALLPTRIVFAQDDNPDVFFTAFNAAKTTHVFNLL